MGQAMLLPPNLGEKIAEKHLVRVVSTLVDGMKLSFLKGQYKGGGTSSYDPRMMLKVLVYAYAKQIYSSRQIASALRDSIYFMWLSGGNQPDFRTINRFRGQILKDCIQPIFAEVIGYLSAHKMVKLEHYFVDGTKIEANANQYSYVWKKSTDRYKAHLQKQVKGLFEEIEALNQTEDAEYGDRDLEEMGEESEIDSNELKELSKRLDEIIKGQESGQKKTAAAKEKQKQAKKALKKLEKDLIPRLQKYEQQEQQLAERNSYSKTDPDATFMRMKDDHLHNRNLKPGYNIQIGTENQFIVGFSTHQNASDSICLRDHLEQVKANLGGIPGKLIADAGYGSEENYFRLEQEQIEAFVKYPGFQPKARRKAANKAKYRIDQFEYDREKDEFICPQGQRLIYEKTEAATTRAGFETERRFYRSSACAACPDRQACTTFAQGRRIQFNPRLEYFHQQASQRLTSEEGCALRSRRMIEAEAVFGLLKHNLKFRRFHLRGQEKVNTEWGLLSIAHNMIKMAAV